MESFTFTTPHPLFIHRLLGKTPYGELLNVIWGFWIWLGGDSNLVEVVLGLQNGIKKMGDST